MRRARRAGAVRLGVGVLFAAGLALGTAAQAASLDGSGGPVRLLDADGDGTVSFLLTGIGPGVPGLTSSSTGSEVRPVRLYFSLNEGLWSPLRGESVQMTARNEDVLDLAVDRNDSGGIDASDLFLSSSEHAVVTYLGQQAGAWNVVAAGWKTGEFNVDVLSSSADTFQVLPLPAGVWLLGSGLAALWLGARGREAAAPQEA